MLFNSRNEQGENIAQILTTTPLSCKWVFEE